MKRFVPALFIILIVFVIFGCKKKSSLKDTVTTVEGKAVDVKGKPLSNIKIKATPLKLEPIKGYEQFETTTGSDGSFRFEKLYPHTKYTFTSVASEEWWCDARSIIETGGEQERKVFELIVKGAIINFEIDHPSSSVNKYTLKVGGGFIQIKNTDLEIKVEKFIPDLTLNKDGHPISRTNQPNNPAAKIIIRKEGVLKPYTLWCFQKVPESLKKLPFDLNFIKIIDFY